MSEVKRSTEHSLELENITIKIDALDADSFFVCTKEPYTSNIRLKIADIDTLVLALQEFQTWLKSPTTETK